MKPPTGYISSLKDLLVYWTEQKCQQAIFVQRRGCADKVGCGITWITWEGKHIQPQGTQEAYRKNVRDSEA